MTDPDFLAKIEKLHSDISFLHHRTKTDATYFKARELANEMTFLLQRNDFRLDEKILDKYNLRGSDKSKEEVINEFKEQSLFDLTRIINRDK